MTSDVPIRRAYTAVETQARSKQPRLSITIPSINTRICLE